MSGLQDKLKYAATTADDWTQTLDKVQRKTIQNRLAQRKRREKVSKSRLAAERNAEWEESRRKAPTKEVGEGRRPVLTSHAHLVRKESPAQKDTTDRSVDDLPLDEFREHSALTEHQFLVLSEFSVARAFVNNATMLAIDAAVLADDEGLSPWTIMNPFFAPETFPRSLGPTPLQLETYHHPFIDLIAPPGLRDNILVARLEDAQEDDLCRSIHHDGLRVWGGQPWSPIGWEFSQSFVDQWGWLLDAGSVDSSNFWRVERGEAPLRLPSAVPSITEML
ncbi:MAG: hypothetical protein Q9173_000429 [Seirophora scorigena]